MVCGRGSGCSQLKSVSGADRVRLCGHVKLSLLNSADYQEYPDRKVWARACATSSAYCGVCPRQSFHSKGSDYFFFNLEQILPRQCTMGPQSDLARHHGFRRLAANSVKCMSNYSELSTYHEYGNIFRCRVQFSRYKSQKSELCNNHWKQVCGSRKVSINRCSKTSTIDILKCYWGYTLVDWNPWLHF